MQPALALPALVVSLLYWQPQFSSPALACKASAGYIYISPSLAAYGLPVSSPALACKASVGSPLLAAYGLPVSSYIYINKYFKYTVYFFNVNPVLFILVF